MVSAANNMAAGHTLEQMNMYGNEWKTKLNLKSKLQRKDGGHASKNTYARDGSRFAPVE
jgi:hypothetical protein